MKLFFTKDDTDNIISIAQAKFPNKYIEIDKCDLFLSKIEEGNIRLEGQSQDIYVSTHYAYEDRVINGNNTRYKVQLTLINIKEDKYQIQYDSYGLCFVVYEDEGIKFIPYEDYDEFITPLIHNIS